MRPPATTAPANRTDADTPGPNAREAPSVVHRPVPVLPRRRPDRVLAGCLGLLGLGLAANAVAGPLVADAVDYGLTESLHNQAIGLEAFSLAVVAPMCLVAAVLVHRTKPAGAVLALAPALYAAYMLVQYVVGPGYERYPPVLLFHLGLFVLSGLVATRAWASIEIGNLPPASARLRRRRSTVVLGLAGFVVLRYLPALVGSLGREPLTGEFAEEPGFFWSILLMDLGIVVPVAVATAVGLWRGVPHAAKALYGLVGWFALVPPSVAAMSVAMVLNDDPNASSASVALFAAAAAAFGAYAVGLYRPLLDGARSLPPRHEDDRHVGTFSPVGGTGQGVG